MQNEYFKLTQNNKYSIRTYYLFLITIQSVIVDTLFFNRACANRYTTIQNLCKLLAHCHTFSHWTQWTTANSEHKTFLKLCIEHDRGENRCVHTAQQTHHSSNYFNRDSTLSHETAAKYKNSHLKANVV